MIWVPVLDSGSSKGNESMRIVYSSFGRRPVDFADIDPEYVFLWCVLLVCVITVWLLRSLRIWSVLAILLGIVMLAFLIMLIADPPMLIWDGQDSQGRATGGMEVGRPAFGALLWVLGGLALMASGVCGFMSGRGNSASRREAQ